MSAATTSVPNETQRADDPRWRQWGGAGGAAQPRASDRGGAFRDSAAGFCALLPREAANSNDAAAAWSASARSVTAGDLERFDLAGGEDSDGENPELAHILSAIADDVSLHCAAVCASINTDFSVRMAQARKSLPRGQVAGALQVLKQSRVAALTFARRTARMELRGRQAAAKIWHGRGRRRPVFTARVPNL